jgi:hypothetical protein
MVFHPAIIALFMASFLISSMTLYSAYYGIQIQRKWDIKSGSDLQLIMERRTYLISTILSYVFIFEIISFFLYIYTAERLHALFVGAMCAAGTLQVNEYGYPALIFKMANFLLAGLWLILNYADNQAYDYPLIKKKYLVLLFLAPLLLTELVLQAGYFLNLRPNIITSCCGSLFSAGQNSLASDLASLPPNLMKGIFYLVIVVTLFGGIRFYRKGKGGYFFSGMSALTFSVSIASIISFISLYYYELPTHHCPFCILQGEYYYVGYPIYFLLFGGAVCGMGVGVLMPFRNLPSLAEIIPSFQKKLTLISLVLSVIFLLTVTHRILFSDFRL